MCHLRTTIPAAESRGSAVQQVRSPGPAERAGDADRDRMADLLSRAHAEGYLDATEFDERLSAAVAARTHGELAAVGADLPPHLLAGRMRQEAAVAARRAARAGLQQHLASYIGVMALLVGIWLAVGVSAGAWYPWPIWPALGWGIGVASHVRAALLRGDHATSALSRATTA